MIRRHGMLWLLGLTLISSTGCLSGLHPLPPVPSELTATHPQSCLDQQRHVYVFLVNGVDPFHYGNLVGVRDYLQGLGYINTYYGQMYHAPFFGKEMRRIMAEDDQARFALVGYSMGAPLVYNLAKDARQDHLPVDLVVFVAGKGVKYLSDDNPDEPIRVIDILGSNLFWKGEFKEPADRVDETNIGHFEAPTDYRTLDTLARELAIVASHVPVAAPAEPETKHNLCELLKPVAQLLPGRLRGKPAATPAADKATHTTSTAETDSE